LPWDEEIVEADGVPEDCALKLERLLFACIAQGRGATSTGAPVPPYPDSVPVSLPQHQIQFQLASKSRPLHLLAAPGNGRWSRTRIRIWIEIWIRYWMWRRSCRRNTSPELTDAHCYCSPSASDRKHDVFGLHLNITDYR